MWLTTCCLHVVRSCIMCDMSVCMIILAHMYVKTQLNSPSVYVTGFGKTCIVHTSDFANFEIHKNHREWCLDVKLSGMIKK